MLPLPPWASAIEPAQRKRIQTERKFRAVLPIAVLLSMNSLLTKVANAMQSRMFFPSSRVPKTAKYLY
jgi:hypothetical protein